MEWGVRLGFGGLGDDWLGLGVRLKVCGKWWWSAVGLVTGKWSAAGLFGGIEGVWEVVADLIPNRQEVEMVNCIIYKH